MSTTWNSMPIVQCPHCGKEQQLDDYYDLDVGDSRECQYCEKEMHIVNRDTTINIELATVLEEREQK
ncbi:hypothetical protein LCGC14_3066560 [marine sediment metagenome]|uniref:Uncharacterized protein n=1 Tax=marine sediment metagenome TaxID=412755 RepID=A0A0F8WHY9_9ZZZZ